MKKLLTIIILSLIATWNAIYLTIGAYSLKSASSVFTFSNNNSFVCDINSTFSCSEVFNNDFSWIFWIPFSAIAMVVYPLIIIIALLWYFKKTKNHFKYLLIIWIAWILFNSYIIYNEFVYNAFCILCLICTLILVIITILSICWIKEGLKKSIKEKN